MFENYKNLWVFVETEENVAKPVGYELLNPGRRLADKMGQKLIAVVVAGDASKVAQDCLNYGADEVITVEGDEYFEYSSDAYAHALHTLVDKYLPSVILIGATNNGRDLGPRLACELKTGLTADCTGLEYDEETQNMVWTRPAFGGNLMAMIMCPHTRPQLGTCRPGVFKRPEFKEGTEGTIIKEDIHMDPAQIRTKIRERVKEVAELVNLEEADIIVAGGRACGGPAPYQEGGVIYELAEALGATVGASRAAVDAGWIAHAHQVGQTGKTVGPRVYVACGISGAIQHLAGITGAETVIAINKDPEAPIFGRATYGVVGDMFKVIPEWLKIINDNK